MIWLWFCVVVVLFGLYCFVNKVGFISFVFGFEYVLVFYFFLEKGLGREWGF